MKHQLRLQLSPPAIDGSSPAVDALLDAARQNEVAWRRFQALSLDLMAADGLEDLIDLLLWQVPAAMQWDNVGLHVVDTAGEIRELLSAEHDPKRYAGLLLLEGHDDLVFNGNGRAPCPRLGTYLQNRHENLFPAGSASPASVALLPLQRGPRSLGSYHIGSNDPQRFHHALATDFLQHLSAVIAICLETAINREQLRRLGLTDALTSVGNRRYFDQRLQEEMARAQRAASPLGCLLIDIDHFKNINDRHGHAAGDVVLQTIAQRIRSELRGADVVARIGGEEFAVLLPQAEASRAVEVAERIRQFVAGTPVATSCTAVALSVSVSIGVATLQTPFRDARATAQSLLREADKALYEAKSRGRNRIASA
jgi:diguanylate cyclase (GGDEF)-like protein